MGLGWSGSLSPLCAAGVNLECENPCAEWSQPFGEPCTQPGTVRQPSCAVTKNHQAGREEAAGHAHTQKGFLSFCFVTGFSHGIQISSSERKVSF